MKNFKRPLEITERDWTKPLKKNFKKGIRKKLQGSPALWKQNIKKLGAVQDFCTVV